MRVAGLVVSLVAMCLPLGASVAAANGETSKCPPNTTKIPNRVSVEPGGVLLVCAPGNAVVKSANGALHAMTPSACFIGPTGARLYFGPFPWTNASTQDRSQSLRIVVERRGSKDRAEIVDGGLHFLRPTVKLAVFGTARLLDGLKVGTFTLFEHVGSGVKGKRVFTGHWSCGAS